MHSALYEDGTQGMDIEAKLSLNVFKLDKQPHISIELEVCRTRCRLRPCLYVCPAHLYALDPDRRVQVNWEGCLECGACLVACQDKALTWHYPRGGFGVQYRFG